MEKPAEAGYGEGNGGEVAAMNDRASIAPGGARAGDGAGLAAREGGGGRLSPFQGSRPRWQWIPAVKKPGGLVFGDLVRSPKWFRTSPDLVVLRINPHGTACVQCEQGTNYCGGIEPADLYVRVDMDSLARAKAVEWAGVRGERWALLAKHLPKRGMMGEPQSLVTRTLFKAFTARGDEICAALEGARREEEGR